MCSNTFRLQYMVDNRHRWQRATLFAVPTRPTPGLAGGAERKHSAAERHLSVSSTAWSIALVFWRR